MIKTIGKLRVILLILLSLVLFARCKDNPTQNKEKIIPSLFLPELNDIEGWVPSLESGHYLETETADGLLELFSGKAQQKLLSETFIQYHFVRGVKQVYQGKINGVNEELEVRIFDLELEDQAQEFYIEEFELIHPGKIELINYPQTGRISVTGSDYIINLDFFYDKWYTWITINGRWGANQAKNIALVFAEKIFDEMLRLYPVDS